MPTITVTRTPHEPRTDFTRYGLLDRAAAYFEQVRKPRTEWKSLDDLSAQLSEFELRYAAENYGMAFDVLISVGEYLKYWGCYHLSLKLHESLKGKIQDNWFLRIYLINLGSAYYSVGEIRKAITCWEDGISVIFKLEDDFRNWGINFSTKEQSLNSQLARPFFLNLGNAYYYLGDMNNAIKYYEKSLTISRDVKDQDGVGGSLCNLGLVYSEIGEYQKSIEHLEQAISIARENSNLRHEAKFIENLGIALNGSERFDEASYQLTIGMKIADDLEYLHLQHHIRYVKSQSHFFLQDILQARTLIEEALQYDEPQNNHNVSALHGIIALRQGDEVTAREAFVRAIGQADEILSKTAEYYEALDAKGLAISGLLICDLRLGNDDGRLTMVDGQSSTVHRQQAIETFRKARKIAPHAGVVKSVLRLFDELLKSEGGEILKEVRDAVEGK